MGWREERKASPQEIPKGPGAKKLPLRTTLLVGTQACSGPLASHPPGLVIHEAPHRTGFIIQVSAEVTLPQKDLP